MFDDKNFERRFRLTENLLTNATENISQVADRLSENNRGIFYDDQPLKTALSLVQNGLECLLKSRLAWHDWNLVIREPSTVTDELFKAGDFQTISFDESYKLLKKPPFNITLSQLKSKELYELRNSRHKHTHYFLELTTEKYLELISYVINFCLVFYANIISKSYFEEIDRFKGIDLKLKKIATFTQVRITSVKKKFTHLLVPLTSYFDCCPNCDQTAPVINSPETFLCLYCKQEDDITYIAGRIGRSVEQSDVKECPECLYQSMGAFNLSDNPESWQCVICGYYTNQPENFNFMPGGILKKHLGKPERRKQIRWPR